MSVPPSWWPAPNPNALKGVDSGALILVGSNTDLIRETTLSLLDDSRARLAMTANINPFGDGHAATRVRSALEHLVFNTTAPQVWMAFSRVKVLEASGFDPEEIAITSTKIARAHPELAPTAGSPVQGSAALRRCGGSGSAQTAEHRASGDRTTPRSSRSTSSSSSPDEGQGWNGLAVSSTRA